MPMLSSGVAIDASPFSRSCINPQIIQPPSQVQFDPLATGIEELDRLLLGGIPRGSITEITGDISSGKTSLLLAILAQAAAREELIAYVDVFDALAPEYLQRMGAALEYLLWIRCRKTRNSFLEPVEKALQASDILLQGGGFGVVVLDLASFPLLGEKRMRAIPIHTWFRLQRALRGKTTILLILSSSRATNSSASLVLALQRHQTCWNEKTFRTPQQFSCFAPAAGENSRSKRQFQGIQSIVHLLKGKRHGSLTIYCRFQP